MEIQRFKNSLAENVFKSKYSNGPNDSWDSLAERLVEDVCGSRWGTTTKLMSDSDRAQLCDYIKRMLFLPGGRYLYYAGRHAKFYNNCFDSSTKALTETGWRPLNNLGPANILSPIDGKFYPAEFLSRGVQKLQKITFANVRGQQTHTWNVRATKQHHWALIDGTDTYELKLGDIVPANTKTILRSDLGFVHGFVFGDGNKHGQLRLCADKDKKYLDLLSEWGTVTYPPSANGDPVLYFDQDIAWKELPHLNSSFAYIAGFIHGWIAADGSETAGNKLCCINKQAIEWFREYAAYAGIVITGELRSQVRNIKLGNYEYKDHEIFIQNYQYGDQFSGFKVIKIEPDGEEEVFCPYEPVHNRIIITHGIDTYQCYLLRAEEDTREEWSAVVWRAMSCLMTGGGIGIDYSRLRASGKALVRTGGRASGPLPLMHTVNEVGRNVMQGGSRRSAIYASLGFRHEDATEFLQSKNWADKYITPTVTYHDAKQFVANNNPAPLDYTNISLNYDDSWGFDPKDPIFLENVKQAMSTGEPGFSFNFGKKQNETLRNACTEVTSEDDSDVCNLGSINLGNVADLDEFRSVVGLASKFLVCGTLRADLPYKKVHDVRERNRRLGLGLMGIHEWLLKNGHSYEVPNQLRAYLEVYRHESESAANEHCDRLYISRPVAYRAIAPTGSIGILAATTTGIEPLYAVAYKRRYLVDGNRWKFQFVVDSTADTLIREHGLNPMEIETATDLAEDYERRIKFQADIQDYVDMSISSTINLPTFNSNKGRNNTDNIPVFAEVLAKYAPRLRGFTCYPDGSRGGQPLTKVSYEEAIKHKDIVYTEHDICQISEKGGTCGA